MCELGATDDEVAKALGVCVRTLYRWQSQHPEFCQALKAGKEVADNRIERALYHKAAGYTYDSEKIFQNNGEVVRVKIIEHVPPDTTAMDEGNNSSGRHGTARARCDGNLQDRE